MKYPEKYCLGRQTRKLRSRFIGTDVQQIRPICMHCFLPKVFLIKMGRIYLIAVVVECRTRFHSKLLQRLLANKGAIMCTEIKCTRSKCYFRTTHNARLESSNLWLISDRFFSQLSASKVFFVRFLKKAMKSNLFFISQFDRQIKMFKATFYFVLLSTNAKHDLLMHVIALGNKKFFSS